jgi:phage-related protein
MTDTFTWKPSIGYSEQSKPKVSTLTFGDGYSQRVSYSTNTLTSTWNLSFINQTLVQASQIIAFLESKGGSEYFLFTPEGASSSVKVICTEWSEEYVAHFSRTITATFKRVYDKTI